MAEIRAEHLTKIFHGGPTGRLSDLYSRDSQVVKALDDLNLTILDGETVSIVGPSGCGKSTFLRVIAGLLAPDEGKVYYDGVDMEGVPPGERGIGIVFQSYALYPHMSSRGNIGFFFKLRHREDEIDERVKVVSRILGVGLDDLLARKPRTLSGGEQQRVAVGRCIARDPKLFLFDEPLSNLDAKLRVQTRLQVKRLLNHFKITSVYVTHDQTEAIVMGDRIAVMRDGRIEQVGPYAQVHGQPINAFVAGFLGQPPMNFFPGQVVDGTFQGKGFTLPLGELGARAPAGKKVHLSIRPEHFQISTLAEAAFSARVDVVQHLVSDRVLILNAQIGEESCVLKVNDSHRVVQGDLLPMRVDRRDLFLFDAETGLRI